MLIVCVLIAIAILYVMPNFSLAISLILFAEAIQSSILSRTNKHLTFSPSVLLLSNISAKISSVSRVLPVPHSRSITLKLSLFSPLSISFFR